MASRDDDLSVVSDDGFRAFLENLFRERDDVRRAFFQLVSDGCDPNLVSHFLAALSAAANRSPHELLSREHFERVIRDLETAAVQIARVGKSQTVGQFDPTGDWARLRLDLLDFVERMKEVAPKVSGRNKANEKALFAKFQQYVNESTGHHHDAQVSLLATAASGGSPDRPIAARQRRGRRASSGR